MRHRYCYLTLLLAFLLGSHEGFVALWITPGGDPHEVYPYRIEALPPADQKRLEAGIYVESEADLIRLLEAYLS